MSGLKVTIADCVGCRDNFYNGNNNLGVKRCWMLDGAKFDEFILVGVWEQPPYDRTDLTKKPTCWRGKGVVKVKPDALDAKGYWRA